MWMMFVLFINKGHLQTDIEIAWEKSTAARCWLEFSTDIQAQPKTTPIIGGYCYYRLATKLPATFEAHFL